MTDATAPSDTPRRRATDRVAPSNSGPGTALMACDVQSREDSGVVLARTRHDPSFVTHLIAVADHCPQTRVLRRAAPADAVAAYRATGSAAPVMRAGSVTRQDV